MNNFVDSNNTSAFYFLSWASFLIASVGTLIGVYLLPVDGWIKGYMALGYLFTLTTCFTLAKTIRDRHESERVINRIKDAKTERLLSDFEKVN